MQPAADATKEQHSHMNERTQKIVDAIKCAGLEVNHQTLFYMLCAELKKLTRTSSGHFKKSVSVKEILDLECAYAEADTALFLFRASKETASKETA